MNQAIVIIPTTGAPELEYAIQSVLAQTVPTDVLVVFDGQMFDRPLNLPPDERIHKLVLPFNTGRGRTHAVYRHLPSEREALGNFTEKILPYYREHPSWYGVRVMMSASVMVNHDYVMVLDQDNWLRPDHVETCINKLAINPDLELVHALRNIHRSDASFICRDDCESLGNHRGISGFMIDTNCYFYRTDFFMRTAHLWLWGWGADRVYRYRIVRDFGWKVIACTGRYTVNYRLGSNPGSLAEENILTGNDRMYEQHGRKTNMPWADARENDDRAADAPQQTNNSIHVPEKNHA
ncbi:MAG: glycosyltransferase family 2 protein [Methylobacillus sp.]|jgi:cellulose synthase/poly-beta-1,6-N-acetylglucosamine synthase-like glycosyltransferase|nr:glycosyltransferase family 2 protein [Methylobacillus sp.]